MSEINKMPDAPQSPKQAPPYNLEQAKEELKNNIAKLIFGEAWHHLDNVTKRIVAESVCEHLKFDRCLEKLHDAMLVEFGKIMRGEVKISTLETKQEETSKKIDNS